MHVYIKEYARLNKRAIMHTCAHIHMYTRISHVYRCGFKGASVFGLSELKADGFSVPELRHEEGRCGASRPNPFAPVYM